MGYRMYFDFSEREMQQLRSIAGARGENYVDSDAVLYWLKTHLDQLDATLADYRDAITVSFTPDGDSSGWTIRQGDRSSSGMTFGEMMGLFIGLTAKSPVRELQWMKTAEQLAAEKKRSDDQRAEREKDREIDEHHRLMQKDKLKAFEDIHEFVGQTTGMYYGDPADVTKWIRTNFGKGREAQRRLDEVLKCLSGEIPF
jgi:hypothetical protein